MTEREDYYVDSGDGEEMGTGSTFTAYFEDGTKVKGTVREIDPNADYSDELMRAVVNPLALGTLEDGREFWVSNKGGTAYEAEDTERGMTFKNRVEFQAIVKEDE